MAETSTIDLISYTSTKIDSKTSTSKAYTDKSCLFDNIFDKVSKAYSKEENHSEKVAPQKAEQNTKKEKSQDLNNSAENKTEAVVENKDTKIEQQKNTEDNSKENSPKNNSEEEKQDSSAKDDTKADNSEVTTPKTEPKADETTQITAQIATAAEFKASADISISRKSDIKVKADVEISVDTKATINNSKQNTDNTAKIAISVEKEASISVKNEAELIHTNTESTSKMTSTADINKVSLGGNAENAVELLALNPQTSETTNKLGNQTNQNTIDLNQPKQTQTIQADFNVELMNSTKALNDNSNKSISIENQTNIDADLKLEQQNGENPQQTIQADASLKQKTDINSPLIEVNTATLAADKNLNAISEDETKKLKEVLDKTALTQEALNKVNAKVISVETSGSNLNTNLKNKQNTEDQVIKLTLESDSSKSVNADTTVDFANITTDSTTQTNFAKTVNVQAQTQTHAQTSKEISDTEILSQINNKLNNIKDEGMTKINIVLKPENLGKINLELVNTKEGLTAQLTTNNAQVKEILDKSIDNLKDTLGSQGVNVNSVSVKVEETQKQSSEFSFENQMGQDNQQSSGNANQSSEQKFSFDEEIDSNVLDTETNITFEQETLSESSISINTGSGKVDYKV